MKSNAEAISRFVRDLEVKLDLAYAVPGHILFQDFQLTPTAEPMGVVEILYNSWKRLAPPEQSRATDLVADTLTCCAAVYTRTNFDVTIVLLDLAYAINPKLVPRDVLRTLFLRPSGLPHEEAVHPVFLGRLMSSMMSKSLKNPLTNDEWAWVGSHIELLSLDKLIYYTRKHPEIDVASVLRRRIQENRSTFFVFGENPDVLLELLSKAA